MRLDSPVKLKYQSSIIILSVIKYSVRDPLCDLKPYSAFSTILNLGFQLSIWSCRWISISFKHCNWRRHKL